MKLKLFIPISALLLCSLLALSCSKNINKQPEIKMLSSYASSQVTGNAQGSMDGETFGGSIYNGSNWYIKKIIITIVALKSNPKREKADVELWKRVYQIDVAISPHSSRDFEIPITYGSNNCTWSFNTIYGIRDLENPGFDPDDYLGEPPKN